MFGSGRNSAALVVKLKFRVVFPSRRSNNGNAFFFFFHAMPHQRACFSPMAIFPVQNADDDDLTAL